ncbi:MAG: hypothetical protein R2792_18695 [Saprospiraceae bacterium]
MQESILLKFEVENESSTVEIKLGSSKYNLPISSIAGNSYSGKSPYCISQESSSVEIKKCLWLKIFSLSLFAFGGLLSVLPFVLNKIQEDNSGALIFIGLVFCASGLFLFLDSLKKTSFNLKDDKYTLNSNSFNRLPDLRISSIAGFQVIESTEYLKDYSEGSGHFKTHYELNILTIETERKNMLKISSKDTVLELVDLFINDLNKKVWWIKVS